MELGLEQQKTNKAEGESPESKMEKVALANFAEWNEALQSKDAAKIAELYSEDCTFLPTYSKDFMQGRKQATGYFKHFLEKNPKGEIIEQQVQPLPPRGYIISGKYNFEDDMADKKGRQIIEARFTYIYQKNSQGKWEISHHHSSENPK